MNQDVVDSYQKIFGNKQKIMVVMAHPDDLELYCGGTVARLTGEGKVVRSVKITSGEMGSRQEKISTEELKIIREKEDRESMRQLGISEENNIYLGFGDGTVENSLEVVEKIVEQIRIFKPDLVITHNPEQKIIRFDKDVNWINHRDHLNTGVSTLDAAYPYSRDLLFFPQYAGSHSVTEFFLVDYYNHPDLVYMDVTDYVDVRVRAHASHSSQYSTKDAWDSADFFTRLDLYPEGKRYERFRYVKAD